MSNSIILSICMMMKDEEKNLKRCLDALEPLLEKPDVELILVDTGSTDQSVSIASQYTSKIFFHPWNNHFSDMRNITISYAKGDWILILDADEALINAGELYELITDIRLTSFHTFIVKIKNYIGVNRDFTILPQERIFRNDGEFKYEGTVHNQPKFKQPVLDTDIYIDHYGYLSNDLELQERKFKRTGDLLREELKKNPNSIYYRYQMAKSYDAHKDHQDAIREIRIAYNLITNDKKNKMYIFGSYALICMKNSEHEEAIKVCKEGIVYEPDYIDLYYMMAESMQKLGMYQEAFEVYIKYVALSRKYNELAISSNRSIEMLFMSNSSKDVALSFIINEMFRYKKFDEINSYANMINEEKIKNAFLFKALLKLKNYDELKELYEKNIDDTSTIDLFAALIEEEKSNLSQNQKKELEVLLSTSGDKYSLLNKIRTSDGENILPFVERIIKMADFNELPDFYADMFIGLEKSPRALLVNLKRFQKSKIISFVKRLIEGRNELKNLFEAYLQNEAARENDFNALKLYNGIAFSFLYHEAGLLNKDLLIIPDKDRMIFKAYIDTGIKYVSLLYSIERLRLYYSLLENKDDKFFIALYYAREAASKDDYKAGLKYYGEAARINPYMSCYMNSYKDELFSGITNSCEG